MFGKHFEAAEATILFIKYHSGGYHGEGDRRNSGDGYATYEVILEVRTRDGQTFRTDIKQYFSLRPRVGDVVKVKYDPKSKKVKVEVRPRLDGAPFTCSLRTFLDPRTTPIASGSTLPVRYDPQDTSRIIRQET